MRRGLLAAGLLVVLALAGCQTPGMTGHLGDPGSDQLGWENGYWYYENVSVTTEDGLNESELNAIVSRAMARVERVRQLEFDGEVSVEVIDRAEFASRQGSEAGSQRESSNETVPGFDDARLEATFLVGERTAAGQARERHTESSVAGYYSPSENAIVLVSESGTATLSDEGTLAHELVHALQNQHFGLFAFDGRLDPTQGRNSVIEGDAEYSERLYMDRCGEEWSCVAADAPADDTASGERASGEDGSGNSSGGGSGSGSESGSTASFHRGLGLIQYFPYTAGAEYVATLRERGGWDAVNEAHRNRPDGATEVIDPARYPGWEPVNVTVGTVGGEWERLRTDGGLDGDVLGPTAVYAGIGYTRYDDYRPNASIVERGQLLHLAPDGTTVEDAPFNYSLPAAEGWAGGRFAAYRNDAGELAYVWRTTWDDAAEARQFRDRWTELIGYWGGQQVEGDLWVIDDGPFADAFRIERTGNTVTVSNAPERGDLTAFSDA